MTNGDTTRFQDPGFEATFEETSHVLRALHGPDDLFVRSSRDKINVEMTAIPLWSMRDVDDTESWVSVARKYNRLCMASLASRLGHSPERGRPKARVTDEIHVSSIRGLVVRSASFSASARPGLQPHLEVQGDGVTELYFLFEPFDITGLAAAMRIKRAWKRLAALLKVPLEPDLAEMVRLPGTFQNGELIKITADNTRKLPLAPFESLETALLQGDPGLEEGTQDRLRRVSRPSSRCSLCRGKEVGRAPKATSSSRAASKRQRR